MEKIVSILERVDLAGFTELLSGTKLKRYVVAFTHNAERSIQLLENQVFWYNMSFDNITIGGRTSQEGDVFIDIGTSTDSLTHARQLQKDYNQLAIRDGVAGREL